MVEEEDIHHLHQCPHTISPLPSSCSDNSSQEGDSDCDNTNGNVNASKYASSSEDDSKSVLDESELGEFLMDTFEGLDSFVELNGIMATCV